MHSISTEQHYSIAPIAKASGGEWHSQRDIGNPKSEAEASVDLEENDNPDDEDDIGCEDFLKLATPPDHEEHDEHSRHLYKCGLHLAMAKAAHLAGDDEQTLRRLNAAMGSWTRLHAGLKKMTQD